MDSILSNTRLFKITIVFILIDNLKDKYIHTITDRVKKSNFDTKL